MPRIELTGIPFLHAGLAPEDAYRNGYRHGYEGHNTRGINCLPKNSHAWHEWERGYTDGEQDSTVQLAA